MSIVADSAPGGLDRASMAKALSKCLQTASFYVNVANTEVLVTDAVSLQNAMPEFARSQRLTFVWNIVYDAPTLLQHLNTKVAFTVLTASFAALPFGDHRATLCGCTQLLLVTGVAASP